MEKLDCIYVIAMLCLDEDGETLLRKRPLKTRAALGHEHCEVKRCLACYYREESRTVGWFDSFEEAEKHVMKYAPWDCLYSHAVIEQVPQGIHCLGSKVIQWYHLIREEGKSEHECEVEKISQPDSYKNIVMITMG